MQNAHAGRQQWHATARCFARGGRQKKTAATPELQERTADAERHAA